MSTPSPFSRPSLLRAPLALLLLASGCGLFDDFSSGPAAQLLIASGDGQEGEVAQALGAPVVVKVVDARGRAVKGQVVNFQVSAGGGQVFAGSGSSDERGLVHELWTLGTVAGSEQTLIARAISSTGEALPELTLWATAQPGPARTLTIANASEASSLNLGERVQLRLHGRDAYGNNVPHDRIPASWSSSAEDVATVDASGLVQAVAGGETTLTVRSGETSAEHVLQVAYLRATLHELPGHIAGFYEAGDRLLAYGGTSGGVRVGALWRWTGTTWEREPGSLGDDVSSVWFFPSGEAWAAGSPGNTGMMPLWTLDSTGNWQSVPSEGVVPRRSYVTGWGADGLVHLTPKDTLISYPVVRLRSGGTWQDLGFPTSVNGWAIRAMGVAARGASEVYVGGARINPENYRVTEAVLGYWDGTGWSFLEVPPLRGGARVASVWSLVAAPSGGPVYMGAGYNLLRLEAGAMSVVPNPLSDAGIGVQHVAMDGDGDLYLFHSGGLAWQDGGQWKSQRFTDGWQPHGRPYVTRDGTVWWCLARTRNNVYESRAVSLR